MKAKTAVGSQWASLGQRRGWFPMQNGNGGASSLFGSKAAIEVERALTEVRAGRPMRMVSRTTTETVLSVDGLDDARLREFAALCTPSPLKLVISATRAQALGVDTDGSATITLSSTINASQIHTLVAEQGARLTLPVVVSSEPSAIVALMKLAQKLPAALVAPASSKHDTLPALNADEVATYKYELVESLAIAGEARVPLANAQLTRFVVFRDAAGNNPVAVVIGNPDTTTAVPVRIHSSCLTGDVFGSRRCDCGDQLQLAISRIEATGGGVVLYMPQEGRGLGLVNKMHAYELQDDGLDTVDANTMLGFEDDERDYGGAARMLEILGISHVDLMTNNPTKLRGLADAGITVGCRMPIEAPVNSDNRRYLTAKAKRAGHQLDYLVNALHATQRAPERVR
ncbi:GTP cyclohydrolase-2 [Variibacter gotjawalensis]|uniref:GTP cyclohydrolase-2 n=2 Tax=Variibacter gotjawalensis TaxID=1333996 RepID=A0A0S3PX51_9BRAD|nr:GTP cyclohydrolase II [Variibacter gotjawalensis]BAT60505.1 GTP cyclohydrolase-2 [Variibacter gotjawalensis]